MSDNNVYVQVKLMPFEDALKHLKDFKPVKRKSWQGAFIYRQLSAVISPSYIEHMTSIPPSVKVRLKQRDKPLAYDYQITKVDSNNLLSAYFPTVEDLMANDWIIVEEYLILD